MRVFPSNPLVSKSTGHLDPIGLVVGVRFPADEAQLLRKTRVYQTNLVPFSDTRKSNGPKLISLPSSTASSLAAHSCWRPIRKLRNGTCGLPLDAWVIQAGRTGRAGQRAILGPRSVQQKGYSNPLPPTSAGNPDITGLAAGVPFTANHARNLGQNTRIPNEPSPIFGHSSIRLAYAHNSRRRKNLYLRSVVLQVPLQQNPKCQIPQLLTIRAIPPLNPGCISDLKLLISSVTHQAGLDAIGTTPRPGKGFRP